MLGDGTPFTPLVTARSRVNKRQTRIVYLCCKAVSVHGTETNADTHKHAPLCFEPDIKSVEEKIFLHELQTCLFYFHSAGLSANCAPQGRLAG